MWGPFGSTDNAASAARYSTSLFTACTLLAVNGTSNGSRSPAGSSVAAVSTGSSGSSGSSGSAVTVDSVGPAPGLASIAVPSATAGGSMPGSSSPEPGEAASCGLSVGCSAAVGRSAGSSAEPSTGRSSWAVAAGVSAPSSVVTASAANKAAAHVRIGAGRADMSIRRMGVQSARPLRR